MIAFKIKFYYLKWKMLFKKTMKLIKNNSNNFSYKIILVTSSSATVKLGFGTAMSSILRQCVVCVRASPNWNSI